MGKNLQQLWELVADALKQYERAIANYNQSIQIDFARPKGLYQSRACLTLICINMKMPLPILINPSN